MFTPVKMEEHAMTWATTATPVNVQRALKAETVRKRKKILIILDWVRRA